MTSENVEEPVSFIMSVINEIIYSPMNLGLVIIIAFLVYKIIKDRIEVPKPSSSEPAEPELPKLRRDFTVAELRQYDGTQKDGRLLLAINGNVFDVTKGKAFYGINGHYKNLAGRDASRNLATFNVDPNEKDEIDDLSDLSAVEMDSVREWEMQFKEKYDLVGKLLRKGEIPTNYEDEEEDTVADANIDDTTNPAENPTAPDAPADANANANNNADGARRRVPIPTSEEVK